MGDTAGITETIRQGWRFGTGLRRFVRDPTSLDEATEAFRQAVQHRESGFLASLDRAVWNNAESPYLPLLERASIDRAAVRRLVGQHGIERTLEHLRDDGVYIGYEEYLGDVPVRRGTLEYSVTPRSFHNPTVAADYLGSTGGTRSSGSPVAVSFAEKRNSGIWGQLSKAANGHDPTVPTAVWLPCLPSAAGLGSILLYAGSGSAPERWFSQIPTTMDGIPASKKLTNTMLPVVGALSGTPLPRPRHTPSSEPGPVLDWCEQTLRTRGSARLSTYPSSAVRLASAALERGLSLDGLVIALVGEPATVGRRKAIERTGARTVGMYAFMQMGSVGTTCPAETAEAYHLYDGHLAVIARRRVRHDGVPVDAFLWTSFSPTARGVFLNVENDDYGTITRGTEGCACLYGQLGSRTSVAEVRGMSKVVAGGVTVPGDVLERLVDDVLPGTIGGTPLDYQFAEMDEADQGVLMLRVDPSLGDVDEHRVREVVGQTLGDAETGMLATAVWNATGGIRVVRETPAAARSGKTLAFEPLR